MYLQQIKCRDVQGYLGASRNCSIKLLSFSNVFLPPLFVNIDITLTKMFELLSTCKMAYFLK